MKTAPQTPVVVIPAVGILGILICMGHLGCKDRGDPIRDNYRGHASSSQTQPERSVTFSTSDGWTLVGDLYTPPDKPIGAVVMLHQRGGSAADWHDLSDALRQKDILVLAIDQRGAGRSLSPDTKLNGKNAPWNTANDIIAAIKWLSQNFGDRNHGVNGINISLVGASYGANNALIYAAAHGDVTQVGSIKSIVLFSPGANYNGLDGLRAAKDWNGPMFIVYATHDQIAGLGPTAIHEECPSHDKPTRQFDEDKHGSDLLIDDNGDIVEDTVDFLERTLQ